MACYHPLKGWPVGQTLQGKVAYKITGYGVDHLELIRGSWTPVHGPTRGSLAERVIRDYVEIPCGQCVGCRLEYSRQWANRCMLELGYHDSAYFVTLTYNDAHVPKTMYGEEGTGEARVGLTLRKRDVQLFFKRLRKAFPDDKIRYYLAGEYGGKTHRPHYHAIIYGLHLHDLKPYKRSDQNYQYYTSESLQKVWSIYDPVKAEFDPIGYVVVGKVSWETCAYTARYIMKKLKGDASSFYELHNLEPEFTVMSRKPGIAAQYYLDHPDCVTSEYIHVSTEKGGIKFRPPRYYDKLFDVDRPGELDNIKLFRKENAIAAREIKLANTNLSYLELLAVEEAAVKARIKALKRGDPSGQKDETP